MVNIKERKERDKKRAAAAARIRKAAVELNSAIYEAWRTGLIVQLDIGIEEPKVFERQRPYVTPNISQPIDIENND